MSNAVLPTLVVLGILGALALFTIGTALWERRPIQPFYIPEPGREYSPAESASLANATAETLTFAHKGLCHDAKGKLYKVRYDFWISSDCRTIAQVGSGTVAGVPVSGIWLYSRLGNGTAFCTTNEIGEQDISGAEKQQTFPGLTFNELVDRHTDAIASIDVVPFLPDAPLAGHCDISRMKAEALVNKGYARYIDQSRTVWKYNLRGAVVFYFTAVWVRPIMRGLRRAGLSRS